MKPYSTYSGTLFTQLFAQLQQQFACSERGLVIQIGTNRSTLRNWCTGSSVPSWQRFLRLYAELTPQVSDADVLLYSHVQQIFRYMRYLLGAPNVSDAIAPIHQLATPQQLAKQVLAHPQPRDLCKKLRVQPRTVYLWANAYAQPDIFLYVGLLVLQTGSDYSGGL